MPPKANNNALAQRKKEQLKQKQKTRRLIWFTTVGVVLALIIVAVLIQPKSKAAEFDYANLPVLGNPEAPVKIVEFGDFKCPACKQVNELIKPQLLKDYIDQGKVAFYFVNLPFISPDSYTAALAVQSVYHQNEKVYWNYFDEVYKNQGDEKTEWATADFLVDLAKKTNLDLDYDKLNQDIVDKTYKSEVDAQYALGDKLKVDSTPTFFINGIQYPADLGDYSALKKYIDHELEGK